MGADNQADLPLFATREAGERGGWRGGGGVMAGGVGMVKRGGAGWGGVGRDGARGKGCKKVG